MPSHLAQALQLEVGAPAAGLTDEATSNAPYEDGGSSEVTGGGGGRTPAVLDLGGGAAGLLDLSKTSGRLELHNITLRGLPLSLPNFYTLGFLRGLLGFVQLKFTALVGGLRDRLLVKEAELLLEPEEVAFWVAALEGHRIWERPAPVELTSSAPTHCTGGCARTFQGQDLLLTSAINFAITYSNVLLRPSAAEYAASACQFPLWPGRTFYGYVAPLRMVLRRDSVMAALDGRLVGDEWRRIQATIAQPATILGDPAGPRLLDLSARPALINLCSPLASLTLRDLVLVEPPPAGLHPEAISDQRSLTCQG
ncbi:hypothetical protein GPECTOR_9g670 [Gonium pectorale]|uniref:Uncharacterized protein n=1 Tax=Gonium pectorale TaxID=33097 RepID=A0A150GRY2_GONPE|nr:hypothetical protein GPECTOR_9g670 [Gonium pectorale]|eukprot:KXZ52625.1 hypothetical protein GPECTOR_9g670 [Gonium pectorale]